MSSYNKVILMGNLTRDVEVRHVNATTAIANFGIATNRKFRTQAGEEREEVMYIDCEAWGKTAEMIAQYFSKGKPIHLDGRLKLEQWEDKNGGGNRSKIVVSVENFSFVSGGGGGNTSESSGGGAYSRPEPTNKPAVINHDDIPF